MTKSNHGLTSDEKEQQQLQNDVQVEFEAIWDSLQNGLEPSFKSYLKKAEPFVKILKSEGIYGDFLACSNPNLLSDKIAPKKYVIAPQKPSLTDVQ